MAPGRAAHLMWDIVELEVEEDLESELTELAHDVRSLSIEERHTHFEPCRMPAELSCEFKSPRTVAVQGDDDALARFLL